MSVGYRFGLFEFDAAAGELRKEGRLVRLEPQPTRALALLVSRPAALVSRDEMRAHIWGADTHVDVDRGLAYCIGQVRTALGDSADNPRFVETLPKRGYRFIAPVQPTVTEPPAPAGPRPGPPDTGGPHGTRRVSAMVFAGVVLMAVAWAAWSMIARDRPIVAVAVFDNETGRVEFDMLAAAAADVMVERLTALGADRLGVIGNTPALRRPRAERDLALVARETGAGYFVFGQIQPDESGVRMVVHLIRLDDNTHLWVTRVARAASDLGGLERVVADRLAEAVRRHVIVRDPDAPRSTP